MYIFSGENQDSRNGDPKARRCRRQIETPNALREGKWGPGRSPGRKRGLVHCELKRSHAVTKNVSIFITFVTHKIRNGHEKNYTSGKSNPNTRDFPSGVDPPRAILINFNYLNQAVEAEQTLFRAPSFATGNFNGVIAIPIYHESFIRHHFAGLKWLNKVTKL